MIRVVATTVIVGIMRGRIILKNMAISLAPSIRAASRMSSLIPFSPAERITIANPVHIQMPTTIRAALLVERLKSHAFGSKFGNIAVSMAFTVPICGVRPV